MHGQNEGYGSRKTDGVLNQNNAMRTTIRLQMATYFVVF